MTGDSQRQDDDFLDDDFIIEDIAGKNDDLDQLFTTPAAATKKPGPTAPEPDADDVLFTDHTQGLNPSEKFQGGPPFGEAGKTQWNGDSLELDEVGVPGETSQSPDHELEAAEQRFTSELGSLLKKEKEEEFALDSESELELVGQTPAADGISEIEQSGPFVIDDGEGNWQVDDDAAAAANRDGEVVEVAAVGADEVVGDQVDGGEDAVALQEAAQEAPVEPGWEPLPATSVDQLSEVSEVARVDGDGPQEAEVAAASTPAELAAVEGHDVYAAEAPAPVLVGPRKAAGRTGSVLRALIAATLLFGTGAAVVLRPQWFGLSVEPERVQNARIERPKVDVVMAPPTVAAANPTPAGTPTPVAPKPVGNDPQEGTPKPADPVAVVPQPTPGEPTPKPQPSNPQNGEPTPPVAQPTPVETPQKEPTPVAVAEPAPVPPSPKPEPTPEAEPVAPVPVAVAQPPVVPTPTETTPNQPTPVEPPTVAVTPPPVVVPEPSVAPVAAPKVGPDAWPVAKGGETPEAGAAKPTRLVRVGDDLMVGDVSDGKRPAGVVDGVLPGSRAFAQLHNGNYFIGSVKCVSAQTITLRIGEGEVTLPTAEVARLTELGSTDYEALQKATAGSVRLTNNNRLVGGILSHVADDHIVLEFRSNRVMLPRSAVGEVVQGEGEAAVRLDVTREEDDWVKNLAERQLGTGAGPALIPERVKPESAPTPDGQTTVGKQGGEKPATPAPTVPKAKQPPKTQPATPPPGRQR